MPPASTAATVTPGWLSATSPRAAIMPVGQVARVPTTIGSRMSISPLPARASAAVASAAGPASIGSTTGLSRPRGSWVRVSRVSGDTMKPAASARSAASPARLSALPTIASRVPVTGGRPTSSRAASSSSSSPAVRITPAWSNSASMSSG
ncbi:hypothetical protein [Actinoplanes sp. N902-109]|uniref:hypothetical protein n=1 Tax=Actinoplanes sp. (strain N902-109) TaxID=649831 RepID=UPI001E2C2366|nr:hypothetical protein [Actinoplanes sp. N902-109]